MLELYWMTPWEFGSGKFVTPCARMQAENLAPCAVFPTLIPMLAWTCSLCARPPEPVFGSPTELGPLWTVGAGVVVVVVDGEAMLATGGEVLPPQPPAQSEIARTPAARATMAGGRECRVHSLLRTTTRR
jgi:hypothetical protein